ncbi:MAG: hypothetical protein ACRC2T_12335 [Thermoguttaceae bacterium]
MSEDILDNEESQDEPVPSPEPVGGRLQFVQQMIVKLRQVLMNRDPMVDSISVDGDSTRYNRKQVMEELAKYETEERELMGMNDSLRPIALWRM